MDPHEIITCPICDETLKKPIKICTSGHAHCGACVNKLSRKVCGVCRKPISKIKNTQLEELIERFQNNMKVPCCYEQQGCKFVLTPEERDKHMLECRYRIFRCEGWRFAKFSCTWSGTFKELEKHFKADHPRNTVMEFKNSFNMKVSFTSDHVDLQLIPFYNGSQYFYYKHKVDVDKKKFYWAFQIISTKKVAAGYYYEFEVYDENCKEFRKFKVNELCTSDVEEIEQIFENERCVVMHFETVKNYLNRNGELPIKFRIMTVKKDNK